MLYLTSKKGNVLMIEKHERKDDTNSGNFTLPGGKLEKDEKGLKNPKGRVESSIRETIDETGIEPINPILKGVILFDNEGRTFSNWKNPDNFYVYIYSAKKFKGEPKESDEGKPRTISLNKVNEVPSNPGDKKMYEWLKDGRNFIGVIKHKGKEVNEEETFVDYF